MKKVILIILIPLFLLSCSSIIGPEEKNHQNWEYTESENFYFYYKDNSYAEENLSDIIEEEERIKEVIENKLEINYSDKITIYIYENIEQTGWDRVGGRAYPKTNTVETIYNEEKKSIGIRGASAHEIVHVIISNLFGSCKFQLLAEGIAVAMDGLWNHPTLGLKEVDEITLYYDELDKIPSLDKINDDFDEFKSSFSYPLSGSFILFLLEKYGPEKFKKLYSQGADKDLEDSINLVYSTNLGRLKNEWINHCRNNL